MDRRAQTFRTLDVTHSCSPRSDPNELRNTVLLVEHEFFWSHATDPPFQNNKTNNGYPIILSPTNFPFLPHHLYHIYSTTSCLPRKLAKRHPLTPANHRLLTLYTRLQASLHTRPVHPKIHHSTSTTHTCLAWSTPVFELYAVAPATASRAELAMAANKVVQYVKREEERVFIIGGAVF